MKKTVLFIIGFVLANVCYAQEISINAQVVDEKIPYEAARQLETKLQNILISHGFVNNGYIERYVLTARIDVTQKDIAPTTPARIIEKMDITFMVGDVIENKVYTSVTIQSSGIGKNENTAFISAFRGIKNDNPEISKMLNIAKKKIIDFYTNNCSEIIERTKSLVATQAYDEALFQLTSVPNICNDCFIKCQEQIRKVYKLKIDSEASTLLEKAKNVWAANQNEQGANEVADIISNINPNSANYKQVVELRNSIKRKLKNDAIREYEFKMKQYEDSQLFKQNLLDAAKAIGVAWGQNKPNYYTVIRHWW